MHLYLRRHPQKQNLLPPQGKLRAIHCDHLGPGTHYPTSDTVGKLLYSLDEMTISSRRICKCRVLYMMIPSCMLQTYTHSHTYTCTHIYHILAFLHTYRPTHRNIYTPLTHTCDYLPALLGLCSLLLWPSLPLSGRCHGDGHPAAGPCLFTAYIC